MAWLTRIGQRRRFVMGLLAVGVTGALHLVVLGALPDYSPGPILAAQAAAIASVIVFARSVCCPGCRRRVVWHVVSHAKVNQWLGELLGLQQCPICRYPGV